MIEKVDRMPESKKTFCCSDYRKLIEMDKGLGIEHDEDEKCPYCLKPTVIIEDIN